MSNRTRKRRRDISDTVPIAIRLLGCSDISWYVIRSTLFLPPVVSIFFAQAEVDADSLQMLHAAHNLLDVLDHTKERNIQLPARPSSAAEQVGDKTAPCKKFG